MSQRGLELAILFAAILLASGASFAQNSSWKQPFKLGDYATAALIAAACLVSVWVLNDSVGVILVVFGFWIVDKIEQFLKRRQQIKTLTPQYIEKTDALLAAREGAEAIEIDVTELCNAALQPLITKYIESGLKVEKISDQSSPTTSLRVSGQASKQPQVL